MRWKWILGICVCLIIALMAAVYVFLRTYDYNKLKPRIARMVSEATGRELNLGGEINLAVGFSPALVVTDITFANAPWGSQPQMVTIDELQAQVRLLPLLARDVELRRIGLKGVEVVFETNTDGQGNWEFPVDKSPAKSAGASQATEINADNIRIENLDLTFRDGKTGSATRFSLTDLKVTRQAADDVLALDLRADYSGQPVTLSGKTGLVRELLASKRFPFQLSGTFSDASLKLEGALDDVFELKGIDLKVQTSGKNLAKLKLIHNFQLPKTSAFDLTGHLRGSTESLALNDLSGDLSGSDVHLAFSGNVGDLIAINDIDLNLKGSGKDLTEIGAIIDQKLPATDQFTVQARLTGSTKALSLQGAQGSARRGSLNLTLNGGIEVLPALEGINFTLKASGKELAEIGPLVGAELPELGPFDMSAKLSGSAKTISLNAFSAIIDKSDFNGQARVEFLKRPKITVRLESSVIDFTALMKSLEKTNKSLLKKIAKNAVCFPMIPCLLMLQEGGRRYCDESQKYPRQRRAP